MKDDKKGKSQNSSNEEIEDIGEIIRRLLSEAAEKADKPEPKKIEPVLRKPISIVQSTRHIRTKDGVHVTVILPESNGISNPLDIPLTNLITASTDSEVEVIMDMICEYIDKCLITDLDNEEQLELANAYQYSVREGHETVADIFCLMIAKGETTAKSVVDFIYHMYYEIWGYAPAALY